MVKTLLYLFIILVNSIYSLHVKATIVNTDSLQKIINSNVHDTIRIKTLAYWDGLIYETDVVKDEQLNKEIIAICLKNLKQKKLNKKEAIFYKRRLAKSYNTFGLIYFHKGDLKVAADFYIKALELYEQINHKDGIAVVLGNLGSVYDVQGERKLAKTIFHRALKIGFEIGDSIGVVNSYVSLGGIYGKQKEYDSAIFVLDKARLLAESIEYLYGQSMIYGSMGLVYNYIGKYELAVKYDNLGIGIDLQINNTIGLSTGYANVSEVYLAQKKYQLALAAAKKSFEYAKKGNYLYGKQLATDRLMSCYKLMGNYKEALDAANLFLCYRDSLINEETKQSVFKQNLKYEYDKKVVADSMKRIGERKIEQAKIAENRAQLKYEKTLTYALTIGIVVVFAFMIYLFNRFRVIKKQRDLIVAKEAETQLQKAKVEQQKEIIQEKHREITDSIHYAERLQRSLMASKGLLDQYLKSYFIYFNPKEKVSGDFYWCNQLSNGNFLLACADSTGHGVPGAIMSMMNMNSLKEAVKEGYLQPHEILNHTRKIIVETLANDGTSEGGKDGMDAVLLSFDFVRSKLSFALANNPLWLIREGKLHEFTPDKMPVGKHDKQHVPFNLHEIDLLKGDWIVVLTDGYPDQFGGPKSKKFKHSSLQQLLLENLHQQPHVIHNKLESTFNEWKGDLEQVDDVCIIGVKI